MSDTQDVRDELQSRLEAISLDGGNLRVVPFTAVSVSPPVAMLAEGNPFTNYRVALDRGTQVYNFVVTAIVSKVSERNATKRLDALRDMNGPASVRAALEVQSGTVVDFVNVHEASPATVFTFGVAPNAVDYLGCTFTVEASLSDSSFR